MIINASESRIRRWLVLAAATALVVAACGGGDDDTGDTDEPASTRAPSSPGATQAPSGGGGGGGGDVANAVEPQVFDVGDYFFHSGFRVEVVGGELWFEENDLTGAISNFLKITCCRRI